MTVDTRKSLEDFADIVTKDPTVRSIAGNPIYTALLITIIIIIIVLMYMPSLMTSQYTINRHMVRMTIVILLTNIALIFINNRVIMDDMIKDARKTPGVFGSAEPSGMVVPRTKISDFYNFDNDLDDRNDDLDDRNDDINRSVNTDDTNIEKTDNDDAKSDTIMDILMSDEPFGLTDAVTSRPS